MHLHLCTHSALLLVSGPIFQAALQLQKLREHMTEEIANHEKAIRDHQVKETDQYIAAR